jgi:four helix bundle protein
LAAWRLSYQLVLAVYDATDGFPKHELYGLTSQARRAAFSIVANIAEGSAKRGAGEFRRFLDVALGSITELEVALRLAKDRRYLTVEAWTALEGLRNHAGAVLWRLYQAIQRRGGN